MRDHNQILLVGSGPMALEYARVLKSLGKDFITVGRGETSAKWFSETTGKKVVTGGIDNFLKNRQIPRIAIVAVSEEQLGIVTRRLIAAGVKLILVEKPGGLDYEDIKKVRDLARKLNAKVYIGYNRRFYASVEKAQQIIKQDGGILSIYFDFTEASFKIAPLKKALGVKENWFLQNSTHVIDLAFFLAGIPEKLISFTKGSIPWHSKGAIFCGAGITKNDVLFSYHANWNAPGRWSLEIMTKNHKLFLKPLENLQIQTIGSFEISDVEIGMALDNNFKPGIHRQVQAFLGNRKNLCTIEEQVNNLKVYQKIIKN